MPPSKSSPTLDFPLDGKLPLPTFLKLITSSGLAMDRAMAIASKIYKIYNTPATLGQLTDGTLVALHVEDKEQRKLVLAAIKKAGYKSRPSRDPASSTGSAVGLLQQPSASTSKKKPSPKKRKRDDDLHEYLAEGTPGNAAVYGSLDFNELLDEQALMTKTAVVNRAPVMTAWATVVAEHMGFKREEALSIASVYTEMNATSKGVKLGIFEEGRGKGIEAMQGGGQPYVDFMGRRPVFSTQSAQWRALLKGEPVPPSSAFKYITNALRQTTGYIVGSMRLLAKTFAPQELNRLAFGLYADFRPEVDGWGKKGEVKCKAILDLRRGSVVGKKMGDATVIEPSQEKVNIEQPDAKRSRVEISVEEYEALLDNEGYEDISEGMRA